jgi:hypothetical protein
MRHIFMLPIAAAFVFGPLAFHSDKAEAMIGGRGLERLADALSPIERAGCWRYGWHGWGWYPRCGWGGPGYYGWGHGYYGGGWGWHRGGWHHGWHRGGGIMVGIAGGGIMAGIAGGGIMAGTVGESSTAPPSNELVELRTALTLGCSHTCVELFTTTRK